MKKVLAILFAMIFVVSTTGLCFAQAAPAKAAREKEAAPAPEKKADDKAKAPEKKAEQEGRQEGRQEEGGQEEGRARRKDAKKEAPKADEKKPAPLLLPKRSKQLALSYESVLKRVPVSRYPFLLI